MEKKGLIQSLEFLQSSGVKVVSLVADPYTQATYKLEKILMNKRVLGDVKKLSPLFQTSALEESDSAIYAEKCGILPRDALRPLCRPSVLPFLSLAGSFYRRHARGRGYLSPLGGSTFGFCLALDRSPTPVIFSVWRCEWTERIPPRDVFLLDTSRADTWELIFLFSHVSIPRDMLTDEDKNFQELLLRLKGSDSSQTMPNGHPASPLFSQLTFGLHLGLLASSLPLPLSRLACLIVPLQVPWYPASSPSTGPSSLATSILRPCCSSPSLLSLLICSNLLFLLSHSNLLFLSCNNIPKLQQSPVVELQQPPVSLAHLPDSQLSATPTHLLLALQQLAAFANPILYNCS
eukprot:superscaffoldBa00000441_g4751